MYVYFLHFEQLAQTRANHPRKKNRTCCFCGSAGCNRHHCPQIARFGSGTISGDVFLNTMEQLEGGVQPQYPPPLSYEVSPCPFPCVGNPGLLATLPSFEDSDQNLSLSVVDHRWKNGSMFRHVLLKCWFRSDTRDRLGKLFAQISLIGRNLIFISDGQDLLIPAREFYTEWVCHRMSRKSVSKIIIVQNLYVNGN